MVRSLLSVARAQASYEFGWRGAGPVYSRRVVFWVHSTATLGKRPVSAQTKDIPLSVVLRWATEKGARTNLCPCNGLRTNPGYV